MAIASNKRRSAGEVDRSSRRTYCADPVDDLSRQGSGLCLGPPQAVLSHPSPSEVQPAGAKTGPGGSMYQGGASPRFT